MNLWQLNEEDFNRCCRLLLQESDQLRDGWSWEPVPGSEEGYLRKTALRSAAIEGKWDHKGSSSDSGVHTSNHSVSDQLQQCTLAATIDDCIIKGNIEDEDDGIGVVCHSSRQLLHYEYHILFSCSYRTPVLYFRAFTLEGKSLSLEEMWNSVHPNFRSRLQHSPLNTISQQEHPLLGQPFFMLHPCRTAEFMRPVLQTAWDQHRPVNYVLTWLSVVGPQVGLDVPLKYFTQLHPAALPRSSKQY